MPTHRHLIHHRCSRSFSCFFIHSWIARWRARHSVSPASTLMRTQKSEFQINWKLQQCSDEAMTMTASFLIGSALWRLLTVLFAVSPTSPVVKLVEEYEASYQELMQPSETTLNYTKTIHFSNVPPGNSPSLNGDNILVNVAKIHNQSKVPALYLPGIDGSGFSAQTQFRDLSDAFELWRMTVDPTDRSTFKELVDTVVDFMDDLSTLNGTTDDLGTRQILLIGESFGSLVSSIAALRQKNHLKGLVLVSPDMAINSTLWASLPPLISRIPHKSQQDTRNVPTPFSIAEGLTLGLLDRRQFQKLIDQVRKSSQGPTAVFNTMDAVRQGLEYVEEALPAETINHRLYHWLSVGSSVLSGEKLKSLHVKSLIVSGGGDNAVPNKKQVSSILNEIPHCEKLEFDDLGHYMLRENVNLTRIILRSNIFARYDPIKDWEPPPREVIDRLKRDWIAPIQSSTSPVFFSTDVNGKRHKGIGHIPNERLLFVANHQFGGLDLQLYVAQLILDRDMFVRGLGHPAIFQGEGSNRGPFTDMELPFPVMKEEGGGEGITRKQGFYEKFGVVPVNPRNFYRLMESEKRQPALLFPGGIREAFHKKKEAYNLFWQEDKVDFVRTAAKFNATIVPISAVGAADSAIILMDADDIQRLPFGLGEGVEKSIWALHRGRYDDNEQEIFHPPLFVPKPLPARHYFLFGKPFRTENLYHKDKQAMDKLYHEVKRELERGLQDLLKARKMDPFQNTVKRMAYERITGRQAPSFNMEQLN